MNQPAQLLCAFLSLTLPALAAEPVSFSRDVLPILSDNCYHCHGPDASSRKSGLRLDLHANALAGGRSDLASIVPGKPDKSEAIRRLFDEGDDLMPPANSHKVLTPVAFVAERNDGTAGLAVSTTSCL